LAAATLARRVRAVRTGAVVFLRVRPRFLAATVDRTGRVFVAVVDCSTAAYEETGAKGNTAVTKQISRTTLNNLARNTGNPFEDKLLQGVSGL
jgi:hypothetical protein